MQREENKWCNSRCGTSRNIVVGDKLLLLYAHALLFTFPLLSTCEYTRAHHDNAVVFLVICQFIFYKNNTNVKSIAPKIPIYDTYIVIFYSYVQPQNGPPIERQNPSIEQNGIGINLFPTFCSTDRPIKFQSQSHIASVCALLANIHETTVIIIIIIDQYRWKPCDHVILSKWSLCIRVVAFPRYYCGKLNVTVSQIHSMRKKEVKKKITKSQCFNYKSK